MECANCGATSPRDARFCWSCGTPFRTSAEERRVVTVLFADLVGFTSLSEGQDPESVTRLVDGAFERLVHDVHSFGGRVDKIVGDAIVALFGAPVAHEDDAERAVRAALKMRETLATYAAESHVIMRMRIGVNAGEVLVGALRAGGDYTAMGDVVNIASRLQTSAEPGAVLVGEATRVLTDRAISYVGRGAMVVRGREQPVETFEAGDVLRAPGYRARRSTPLVGRDAELSLLEGAVKLSIDHRRGQVILILGEAGVGKTRLANAVQATVDRLDDSTISLSGRCVPYGEANPWWPVAEAIRQACGVDAEDPLERTRDRIAATLEELEVVAEERDAVSNGLLHVLGHESPLRGLEPARARGEADRALLAFMEAGCRKHPVSIRLSDLQWADEDFLELVDSMSQQLARLPFVLVATARRSLFERWSPRAGRHNVMVLNLDALDRQDAADLLDALIPASTPVDLRETLLDRSGGNPFYLEELARLVTERGGDDQLVATEVPATLRGLLAARVDALSPAEQATVEDAAVWGSSGHVVTLAELARRTRGVEDLSGVIDSLVVKDVFVLDDDEWSFRSDVIREVAYSRLTRRDRFGRHVGIAEYLDRASGGRFVDDPFVETVARHYAAAAELLDDVGLPERREIVKERARWWLTEAVRRADAAASWLLAERLASQALALSDEGRPEDDALLSLLLARAHARAELWNLTEARTDADHAAVVAARIGDPTAVARVQRALAEVAVRDARHDDAMVLLDAAIGHYRESGDVAGEAEALRLVGLASLFRNDFTAAEGPIRAALEAFDHAGDRRGQAWALQNLAWIAFIAGRTGEADERLAASMAVFEEIGDRGGLAWAQGLTAFVRMNQGRFAEARSVAEAALDEAIRRRDRWGEAMMLNVMASIDLWEGRTEQAVDLSDRAVRLLRGVDESVGLEQALAISARANAMAGRLSAAFALFDEAIGVRGSAMLEDGVAVAAHNATMVQLGQPGRVSVDPAQVGVPGGVEPLGLEHQVALALAAAQGGDIPTARRLVVLGRDVGDGGSLR